MISSQVESKKPKLRNVCSSVEKLAGKMEVGRNLYCMYAVGRVRNRLDARVNLRHMFSF